MLKPDSQRYGFTHRVTYGFTHRVTYGFTHRIADGVAHFNRLSLEVTVDRVAVAYTLAVPQSVAVTITVPVAVAGNPHLQIDRDDQISGRTIPRKSPVPLSPLRASTQDHAPAGEEGSRPRRRSNSHEQ